MKPIIEPLIEGATQERSQSCWRENSAIVVQSKEAVSTVLLEK